MNTKIIISISLSIGLLALTACATSKSDRSDLTGHPWELTHLSTAPVIPGSIITAHFGSDNTVNGSAGCNRYSGSYKTTGSRISFSSPMASTLMACEESIMQQESKYFTVLSEASSFRIDSNQLILYNDEKNELAKYRAVTQDLAGTSWQAVGYNNGKQAVTSVLIGTTLTADFGTDGRLSGNSGCNKYTGSYQADENQITIGPLASTKMYCNDPDGIMEQETLYLEALQSASTYLIDGNSLEMRNQEGALEVDFIKVK